MRDKHRHPAKTSNKVGIQCANGMQFIKGHGEEEGVPRIRPGLAGITWLAREAGAEDESETKGWKKRSRGACNYRERQRQYAVVAAHTDWDNLQCQ